MLSLRNAAEADLGEIRRIYEYAQDYMIRSGNPTQWGRSLSERGPDPVRPSKKGLQGDIR